MISEKKIINNNLYSCHLTRRAELEKNCQVAKSFHVKPLLNWLQGDN